MLKPHNAALLTNLLGQPKAILQLYKTGKQKGKLPYFFASYCPFCGERYPEDKSTRSAAPQAGQDGGRDG